MKSPAHFVTYGLREMGLPKSDPPINNQRIEGIGAWFFRNSLSRPAGYPVAVTFYKNVKGIYRIQLGIDLHFLQAGYNKSIFHRVVNDKGKIHFVIRDRLVSMCGY